MYTTATPEFIAAEVAYRFETGRVGATSLPRRRPRIGRWFRGLVHPTHGQHVRTRSHRTRTLRA